MVAIVTERNPMDRPRIQLVYDKQCPACSYYVQLARVRDTVGELELVDARRDSKVMAQITERGLDIDQGMVLIMDDTLYYGADAIHMLALISTRSGFFNRLTYRVFGSRAVAGVLYPILRSLRNLLLKLLGRSKINNLEIDGNDRF